MAASARRRRRELAVLQTLGMTRRQLRSVITWQTLTQLLVAVIVGIVAGRWTWAGFASSLGVDPVTVVPLLWLGVGLVSLVVVGVLLTSLFRLFSHEANTAVVLRPE